MTQQQATYSDPVTHAQPNVMADIYHHVIHLQQQVHRCKHIITRSLSLHKSTSISKSTFSTLEIWCRLTAGHSPTRTHTTAKFLHHPLHTDCRSSDTFGTCFKAPSCWESAWLLLPGSCGKGLVSAGGSCSSSAVPKPSKK